MAVLGDRACEEHRERYDSGCEEGHEDEMRTRLRNDAYQCGKQYHQGGVVTDPSAYVYVLQGDTEYKKHTECPCEYCRKMLLDYVIPEVSFHEVVGAEQKHEQYDYTEGCKKHVHPVLAQEVDGG